MDEQAEAYPEAGLFSDEYQQAHPHRQRLSEAPSHRLAFEMIEDYSQRNLTHIEDRFDAFMGAATIQTPGGISPETCATLRGLPSHSFWESLTWKTRPQSARSHFSHEVCTRIERNLGGNLALPSWSWVGWTGDAVLRWYDSQYTLKPRVEAILLDTANIFLRPTAGPDKFPFWEPWPFEPTPLFSKIPNAVTLHMWAPCVDCHFVPFEETDDGTLWATPRSNDTVPCAILLVSSELTDDALDSLAGRPSGGWLLLA